MSPFSLIGITKVFMMLKCTIRRYKMVPMFMFYLYVEHMVIAFMYNMEI